MKVSAYEKVLEQVGAEGKHQHLLVWLFVVPFNFLIPWIILAPIFFSSTPDHHCSAPPLNNASYGSRLEFNSQVGTGSRQELWDKFAIPRASDGLLSKCSQFNVTWSDFTALTESQLNNDTMTYYFGVTNCQHGYTYDTSEFTLTLPSSLDWVCESEDLTAMWLSIGVGGNVIGTLLFTPLGDIYGRRPVVAVTALVFAVFGSLRIYVSSLWLVMLTHFVACMPFPAILELSLIIVLEQVSPGWRSSITSASFIFWTAGMCILPLMAWAITNWEHLCLVTSAPFVIFAACYWCLPESPSWMLSRGRVSDTAQLLSDIAVRNGNQVPPDLEEQLNMISGKNEHHYGPLQLLQKPVIRKRTILLTICYTCNTLVYYGLTYNIDNMSGNQFLNFFLFGICELPANFLGWWLVDIIGRRWAQVGAFFASVCFSLMAVPLLGYQTWIPTILLTCSKLCVTLSFLVIYIQSAEIFPTSHRGSGTGFSSIIAGTIAISTPYIAYMSHFWKGLPYITLSVIGTIGMIAATLLPETLGEDLPQSIDDAECFLPQEKFLSYKGKKLGPGCRWYNTGNSEETGIKDPETSDVKHRVAGDKDLPDIQFVYVEICNSWG